MHYACKNGHKEVAALLISKGADVNAKDSSGLTPLHAVARWYPKMAVGIANLLLANGADINLKDNQGRTPVWYAKGRGNAEVVELLRKHGAKE